MSGNYQCPECKFSYATVREAKECLANCLDDDLHYACPYCESVFESKGDAAECAAECYIKENKTAFVCIGCTCETCAHANASGRRLFPCPHVNDVTPPDTCGAYDPDVRHFGTGLTTEFQLERTVQA